MIKWGIVATGNIANQFARGLALIDNGILHAVASRDEKRAKAFAQSYQVDTFYGSYEALAMDADIDIVYIGTPNNSHLELTKMFLNAGKHVLCEKPIGVNHKQTTQMVKLARAKNLFLMEGMWTRFFPVMRNVVDWVLNGDIGELKFISANFGFEAGGNWRKSIALSGGSLLDVGIYPLSLVFLLMGKDYTSIKGAAVLNKDGVDEINSFVVKYPNKVASLASAVGQRMHNRVFLEGTKGRIYIDGDWWRPRKAILTKGVKDAMAYADETQVFEDDYESTGFQYEADHVCHCLMNGLTESPIMTLDDSLAIATAMDTLCKDFGVIYRED